MCIFQQVQYYLQLAQQHQQALQATGAGGVQILQQAAVPTATGIQTIQIVQPQATQVRKLINIFTLQFRV